MDKDLQAALNSIDEKTRAILALDLVSMIDEAILAMGMTDVGAVRALLSGMKLAARDIIKRND
jgi:hypothetical protein